VADKAAQQRKDEEPQKSAGQKPSERHSNRAAEHVAPRQQTEGRGAEQGMPTQARGSPAVRSQWHAVGPTKSHRGAGVRVTLRTKSE